MSPALRLAQGAQGVGRLARLAQDEDERPVVERGVAVAELAGVLDLDRQVGEPLDQVLAHERGVPARAAGGEDDPADAAELPGGQVQAAEDGGRLGASEPAPAGVAHGLGLLADLLEHVVRVAAQLDGVGLPVEPVDPRGDRPALAVADLEVVGREPDDLAVLQVDDPRGVRRRVATGSLASRCSPSPRPTTSGLPSRAPTTWPGRRGTDDAPGRRSPPAGARARCTASNRSSPSPSSRAIRWAITSVSVWLTKRKPSASSSRRRATWFSITPLWTTATEPRCGRRRADGRCGRSPARGSPSACG